MNNYETIKEKILAGEFKKSDFDQRWAGSGACITNDTNDKLFQDTSVVVVYTQNSSAVVWLIEILKEVANIDFSSKYDFYPTIAKAVTEYIKTYGDDNAKDLLLFVLEKVSSYV